MLLLHSDMLLQLYSAHIGVLQAPSTGLSRENCARLGNLPVLCVGADPSAPHDGMHTSDVMLALQQAIPNAQHHTMKDDWSDMVSTCAAFIDATIMQREL